MHSPRSTYRSLNHFSSRAGDGKDRCRPRPACHTSSDNFTEHTVVDPAILWPYLFTIQPPIWGSQSADATRGPNTHLYWRDGLRRVDTGQQTRSIGVYDCHCMRPGYFRTARFKYSDVELYNLFRCFVMLCDVCSIRRRPRRQ